MRISLIVFQLAIDRFSALAIDVEQDQPWRREYPSVDALIADLRETGIATFTETRELEMALLDRNPLPMLRIKADAWDLEHLGFVRVPRTRPN